ncbi:protein kinase [Candidatus Woesearchaeota archaeon]|nr:protein kinase [Candidatus Woesearchaeota archaeon]
MAFSREDQERMIAEMHAAGPAVLAQRLGAERYAALQHAARSHGGDVFEVLRGMNPDRFEQTFVGGRSIHLSKRQSPPQQQAIQPYAPGGTVNQPQNVYANVPPPAPLPPQPAPLPIAPQAGLEERIGAYKVLLELGRGGMGRAVQAYDERLKRPVVIKTILASDDVEARLRFEQEARSAAKVQHENVVRVYEVGQHGGEMYLAMEFIPGSQSLRNYLVTLANSEDRWVKTAEIIKGTADGVAAAHKKNVIHRDLKPDNVLMTGDGTPKVIDFGLAKDLTVEGGLTVEGSILGTPEYMPPEQIKGLTGEIDALSDVYSLGAILYEMLTLARPYGGRNYIELADQITNHNKVPPSPRSFEKTIPAELEIIAMKALSKSKADRYPSADAMAEDLQRFLDGEPILAMPEGALRRFVRGVKRHAAPILGGLAVVATTAAGVVYGVQSTRAARSEARAAKADEALLRQEQETAKTVRDAEVRARNSSRDTYRRLMDEAIAARRFEEAGRHYEALYALSSDTERAELVPSKRLIDGITPITIRVPAIPRDRPQISYSIFEVNGPNATQVFPNEGFETRTATTNLKRGRRYHVTINYPVGSMDWHHYFVVGDADSGRTIELPSIPSTGGTYQLEDGRRVALPVSYFVQTANNRGFFVGTLPVTMLDYTAFLRSENVDSEAQHELTPRVVQGGQTTWYTASRFAREGIVMGRNTHPIHPLVCVSARQAERYAAWLTERLHQVGLTDLEYRLPTRDELLAAAMPDSGNTYPGGILNGRFVFTPQDAAGKTLGEVLKSVTLADPELGYAHTGAKYWDAIGMIARDADGRFYEVGANHSMPASMHAFLNSREGGVTLYHHEIGADDAATARGVRLVIAPRK